MMLASCCISALLLHSTDDRSVSAGVALPSVRDTCGRVDPTIAAILQAIHQVGRRSALKLFDRRLAQEWPSSPVGSEAVLP